MTLGFGPDRVQRFFDPGGGGVAVLVVAHGFVDGFDQVRRGLKIKNIWIAYIQWKDCVSLASDLFGDGGKVPNGIADVFETVSSVDLASLDGRHNQVCNFINFSARR